MRKFSISVKDILTGMEVLLDMCNYNNACAYLWQVGFDWKTAKTKTDYRKNRTIIYHEDENKNIVGRVFVYDETRGLLLGD